MKPIIVVGKSEVILNLVANNANLYARDIESVKPTTDISQHFSAGMRMRTHTSNESAKRTTEILE